MGKMLRIIFEFFTKSEKFLTKWGKGNGKTGIKSEKKMLVSGHQAIRLWLSGYQGNRGFFIYYWLYLGHKLTILIDYLILSSSSSRPSW
jgi:hypothetical protein